MSEQKPWMCKNGHVLGCVRRNASKIPQLQLYREALDPARGIPQQAEVIAIVEEYAADVRCSVPGAAALRKLLIPHQELMLGS